MRPSVVFASKSGASAPSCKAIISSSVFGVKRIAARAAAPGLREGVSGGGDAGVRICTRARTRKGAKPVKAGRDYSLIGPSAQTAAEQGLVAAEWYHAEVPRKRMKELMRRADGPALRDTAIWLVLLAAFGLGGAWFWGSWACVPFFIAYGVLYGSATDSRWHETGHGTAFATSWLNDALYQLASFMNLKEPTFWRWSHARHHTDTIIVGRDREKIGRAS